MGWWCIYSGFIVIHSDVGGDWNMTGLFFHSVGNVIIPTDELICFRGVGLNHQPGIFRALMSQIPIACFMKRERLVYPLTTCLHDDDDGFSQSPAQTYFYQKDIGRVICMFSHVFFPWVFPYFNAWEKPYFMAPWGRPWRMPAFSTALGTIQRLLVRDSWILNEAWKTRR